MRQIAAAVVALVALTFVPRIATGQETGRFDRALTASGPVDLSIVSGSGSIVVRPGADGNVRVVGTVRAANRWTTSAEEQARVVQAVAANPPIVQNGGRIDVGRIDDPELARRVAISYEVTVPHTTRLTLKTGSGSLDVGALAGPVSVSTGSGSVEVGAIGDVVQVSTGSGSVKVDGGRGTTVISTGSGTVHAGAFEGDLRIRTGSGGIHVDRASGGVVELESGSGSLNLRSLDGGLTARSASGSIAVSGSPRQAWNVSSGSGQVTLRIPAGTAFGLQANSSSGGISTDHEVQVRTVSRRELAGTVGGGGPLVTARTSSGRIVIRKE